VPLSFEEPIYGSKDPLFFQFISFGITMATFHGLSMALAAVMLALERREGHLERAFVSGVKPTEILLSHMIFIFSAILSSVSLSILFQFLVFDTPSISQILDVFALLVLQCLQGMNFGLFVALIVSDMMFVGVSYLLKC
jgi:ABC-type transport system involved in Fe-S cluster assembly fused permease/ATPase subunit